MPATTPPPAGDGSCAFRVVIWNVEWASQRTGRGQALGRLIRAQEPDLVCLTEVAGELELPPGHWVTSAADYGYKAPAERRKVGLWSRHPWSELDRGEGSRLPEGRFARARTLTPAGPVEVVGVCIPWQDAHVRTGRRDRERWQDHAAYLEALRALLAPASPLPRLVVGDFNQRIPRTRQPKAVADQLESALASLSVATVGRGLIDHLAHCAGLRASGVAVLDAMHDGMRLSDHVGVVVDLERAPS